MTLGRSIVLLLLLAACGGEGDAAIPKPVADPNTDPATWKALLSTDKVKRAAGVVDATNYRSADAAKKAYDFLKEREEDEAAKLVAKRRLDAAPECEWAHGTRGEADVQKLAAACLKECELADSENFSACEELRKLAGTPGVPNWANAETTKRVERLCAAIRQEEARRANPYENAIETWVKWQHGFRVMRNLAEVHAATGPYLVFVSFDAGGKDKKPTKEQAARAAIALDRNVKLLSELHAAWTSQIAGPLKLTVYGPENADEKTLLKAIVFMSPDHFVSYQFEQDPWSWDYESGGAQYVSAEPRFLAAVDSGVWPGIEAAIRVESVRQLVHFHTWDETRKSRGRVLDHPQCMNRAMWSNEGFPRFFAHRLAASGGAGAPPPGHPWLSDVFHGRAVAQARQWKPWTMAEQLSVADRAGLTAASRRHSGETGESGIGTAVMSALFVGRATSLADFLWNAAAGGTPKYRDRYLAWLGGEMVVKTRLDHKSQEICVRPGADDFRRAFGLVADDALAAFEQEWDAYEAALIDKEKETSWPERVKSTLAELDAAKKK